MVIKGKARGGGKELATYLTRKGENEHISIMDIRGTSQPGDIHKSLLEMSLTSELTKSDKGLYHAQMNPAYGEDKTMTQESWLRAADILEQELGLAGQKRVIVIHEKNDRLHAHVVWERYDHEKGIMVSDSYNRYAHNRARRTIEMELGHKITPERNLKRPKMKVELTDLWHNTETGEEFKTKAEQLGYVLAFERVRRSYRVIDQNGTDHDLRRQIGDRTQPMRDKMKGQKLPSEKEAIKIVRNRQAQKSLDIKQELFMDSIGKFNMVRGAEEDKKQLLKDKSDAMKEAGREQTTKRDLEREKLRQQFLEQMEEMERKNQSKKKDKGLDLG